MKWICWTAVLLFAFSAMAQTINGREIESPLFDAANIMDGNDEFFDMAFNAKLADSGDMRSQYVIGRAYEEGKYTPRNMTKAVIFYKRSAAQGHFEATHRLGTLYAGGDLVVQDIPQAMAWFELAAVHGYVPSMLKLSEMYQELGTDSVKAYYWMAKAAQKMFPFEKNLEKVCPDLKGLAFLLTEEEQKKVQNELKK